jgi:hypothetical protein
MRSGLMGQLEEEVQSLCGFNARTNALSQCSRDKPELGPAAEANSRAPRAGALSASPPLGEPAEAATKPPT